jgi:hypothetical protein
LASSRPTLIADSATPELAADPLADQLPGPQRELELQLPRIPPDDQLVDPGQLRPR